ncbi:MAG TPA: hypothetical protein VFB32_08285 [Rudaea sp.]|nr:hypothetical protein [Rudaea sp.]
MLRSSSFAAALPCLLALAVTACSGSASVPPAVASADAAPLDPAHLVAASAVAADNDEARGEGYEYHIRYPELDAKWDGLEHALRAFAAERKGEFLAHVANADETAGAPLAVLDLEFEVARRTEDFLSVLARGTAKVGIENTPIVASFVMRLEDGKLLALGDLFGSADAAYKALSDECRRQLEGRLEANLRQSVGDTPAVEPKLKEMRARVAQAAAPTADNLAVFLIDGLDSKAIGLTIVFPPDKLGDDAGEQQVEVPSKVFYSLLKPEYQGAFQIDTEALKPGVR